MVTLDAAHLPYNRPLLDYLRDEHAAGRKLYLATGADRVLARKIAAHLGIFDDVIASDGRVNLTGRNKLQHLEQRFAADGFDYIGNALPDLPLLQGAQQAMVANPALRLEQCSEAPECDREPEVPGPLAPARCLSQALRVHQWAKNLLVFLPLLLAHSLRAAPVLAASRRVLLLLLYGVGNLYFQRPARSGAGPGTPEQAQASFCRRGSLRDYRAGHLVFAAGNRSGLPPPTCHERS